MFSKTALFLMLAAALGACGDEDPSDPVPAPVVNASYELDVTGALSEAGSGRAFFGADTDDEGEPVFALVMGEDTSRHVVIAARRIPGRPVEGTYPVAYPGTEGDNWELVHVIGEGDELLGMFVAEAGTLTITKSTADVLEGAFEFEAAGFFGDDMDAAIAVSGEFVAIPASQVMSMMASRRLP